MKSTLLSPELRLPAGPPRSEGIHQSKVVRAIAAELGILDAKWVEDISLIDRSSEGWWDNLSPDSQLRIAIGMAWEEWYLPQLENVVKHPGEMVLDGIFMTPDGEELTVIFTSVGLQSVIHEVKTTYKSIHTVAPSLVDEPRKEGDLASEFMWLTQIMGYCKAAGTTVAYLHVLFICGDYKFPITPQLHIWRLEFTQQEIDESWAMQLQYIEERRKKAEQGEEPL